MEPVIPAWERFESNREIGQHLLTYDTVGSTMDVAWSLAETGAEHGTVVRAQSQSQGRGRFSRRWVAEPGESLLVSVLLRSPASGLGVLLPIAATLALRDTVRGIDGLGPSIKWPNDVLVKGRKIAGVLVEVRADTDGHGIAVLGIGLNVNMDPANHPDIREAATSIRAETGAMHSVESVGDALFDRLADTLRLMTSDADFLVARWREGLATIGTKVTVRGRQAVLSGTAEDVDGEGCLLLRTPDGVVHRLAEGDVTLGA
jgi:BirA family biotin operon repressor/biotin-[acetyl-CoA-carboxylase] ligase